MAYDKNILFDQAKSAIQDHELFFIEDIVAYLPCHKSTFYEHFPTDSNEYDELKSLLNINRTTKKVALRQKWFDSEAPALQMALMKLIATPEELRRLSMSHIDHTTDGEKINQVTVFQLPDDGRNKS